MITITNGNPVRASKYYKNRKAGFTSHWKEEPLYAIGKKTSKGIQHTRDIKGSYSTEATVMFMYDDEETDWEELEKIAEELGLSGFQRIWLWRGKRIKALKSAPENTFKDLNVVVTKANQCQEFDSMEDKREDPLDTVHLQPNEVTA